MCELLSSTFANSLLTAINLWQSQSIGRNVLQDLYGCNVGALIPDIQILSEF